MGWWGGHAQDTHPRALAWWAKRKAWIEEARRGRSEAAPVVGCVALVDSDDEEVEVG